MHFDHGNRRLTLGDAGYDMIAFIEKMPCFLKGVTTVKGYSGQPLTEVLF
jgi:hypothetical protein